MSETHTESAPVPEPVGPATATAAQEKLAETATPPSLIAEKPAEEKPTEKAAEVPLYDATKLTFPEGFVKDDALMERFGELAKALPHDTAQQLVGLYAEAVKASTEKVQEGWNAQQTKWQAEAMADEELKGARLDAGGRVLTGMDAVKVTIARVLDNVELTDPGFREALNYTGAGNNPAMIKTLYRWASQLVEGSPVQGGTPATAPRRPASAAAALYPNLPNSSGA